MAPSSHLTGRLAFDDGKDVYVLDLRTGRIAQLTDGPAREMNPVWSPDGASVAYRSNLDGTDDVWLMDRDGRDQRNLSRSDDRAEWGPTWSPDGKWIAFNTSQTGNAPPLQIRIVAVADGASRLLDTSYAEFPDWAPDGSEIALASMRPGARGINPDYDLKVVRADGSKERAITTTPTIHEMYPQWSPDGSRLVFMAGPVGVNATYVWTIDVDGGGLRRLTEINAAVPVWSPDGAHVAFLEPSIDVHVMRADGGGLIDLGLGPNVGFVSWAR